MLHGVKEVTILDKPLKYFREICRRIGSIPILTTQNILKKKKKVEIKFGKVQTKF